jgi:rRNA maturation protein Nop10
VSYTLDEGCLPCVRRSVRSFILRILIRLVGRYTLDEGCLSSVSTII